MEMYHEPCYLCADGPLPAVLQEVDLPVISNSDCEKMYERAGFREHIPHIFICAGYAEGGKDSCEVNQNKKQKRCLDDEHFIFLLSVFCVKIILANNTDGFVEFKFPANNF